MFKTLLRKQITEVFRNYFYDYKNNKPRTRQSVIFKFLIYAVLMIGVIGGMFAGLASSMCMAFASAQMDWLYFVIMGMLGALLGVFGSVFSTYSGLYLAKDNDTLLAMPIPLKYIIGSRLLNVYIMGAMYSVIVLVPAVAVYWISGFVSLSSIIGGIVYLVVITLFVMVLSCLLGWVVARLSTRLKNKSAITVVISLLALGAYYFFYFKAQKYINIIIENAATYGGEVRSKAPVLYYFGTMGSGNYLSMLIFLAGIVILTVLAIMVISKSFISIATDTGTDIQKEYKGGTMKKSGISQALLRKEMNRFTGSATYMLNCGLGIIIMMAGGIVLLIKGGNALEMLSGITGGNNGFAGIILFGIMALLNGTNDVAAPSVSLEGKNIWILQSMPVSGRDVLRAKLHLQLIMSLVPTAIFTVCGAVVLKLSVIDTLLFVIASLTFAVLSSNYNMFLGIKMPILNWTSEIIPIKQSGAIFAALFGGWGIAIILAGPYFLLGSYLSVSVYFLIVEAVMIIVSLILNRWVMTRGAAKFEEL